MDLGLDGRRALVGGGSAGIGAGIAGVLAAEGARLVLAGSTSESSRHAQPSLAPAPSPLTCPRRMAQLPPSLRH